ncbi:hypothetical protein QQS21_010392 [Conoideocrella luteorostrata]|uniref:Uncharacterized protein n=1 Tax=Conoideocrella luteorostrata TaxID=1105319 RepID=A0AAJ0CHG2_9HYPO|nr:hypothetical protein QQS21_010392 [Conoideocrella luteorostrata]
MGKTKHVSSKASVHRQNTKAKTTASTPALQPAVTTTSAVAADPMLGYKIRVLLHDFLNVTKDPNSARRIDSTTHELYISTPYFDDSQAVLIKAALVDISVSKHNPTATATEYAQTASDTEEDGAKSSMTGLEGQTFETAVQALLSNFIDKRRSSGDTRPCGPHHLAPMYACLFGIELEELNNEKFLGRLRKAGV